MWFLSLPTRLFDARNYPLVSQLAEANPANAELTVNGTRSATNTTTRLASRGVLRLPQCFGNFRFTRHVVSFQVFAISHPSLASNNVRLTSNDYCYAAVSSVWNGMPKPRNNSRASSSLSVELHKAIFMPCTRMYLSGFNSGKTSCSLSPKL